MNANFEKMCRRTGGYSLPWLIKLSDHADSAALYFVNDVSDCVYDAVTYKASTFEYSPNEESMGMNGGGSLSITTADNAIIEMIETYYNLKLQVIGVLHDSTVTPIRDYMAHYGSVRWDGKRATFNFERDDRLDMTFPALVFSHYNNRGNA